ncbi:MAG: RluA family pseudouridine synthase [Acidimicrobiales bacterium]|nr:RluA family pseudouridine synthase [Acidimicrobiales bacterium]
MHEEIPNALDGERVDRVAALMTGLSRSVIADLISEGKIFHNEKSVTNGSFRVSKGDQIEVEVPKSESEVVALVGDPTVQFDVVYEDDCLFVVNKPVGLVVHPGAGRAGGTLAHGLLARYPEIANVGPQERPGIVHRLDRDTSGLLLCARTNEALHDLTEALSAREIHRSYLTLVGGSPEAPRGTVDAPIGRSRRARTKMTVTQGGREAKTHYEVLETWKNPIPASLLRCVLDTGRTHQIRVHLQAIGTPVLGDSAYGKPDPFEIGRPLLHAAELAFTHPTSGESMQFTSEPPDDFEFALAAFREQNRGVGDPE